MILASYAAAVSQDCTSNRYQARIFDSVAVTTDIIFGNAPAVTNPYISENITFNKDLKLDLFEPLGDTLDKRPLVVMAFGGGFLLGAKEDEDIQATCDSLARLGYVTASINYRLGMSLLIASSAERAVYRGVQDFSAAVRFFKEFANVYRIDTNYIFAGGVSAGSISALQMAFGEEGDRPPSTFATSFPNSAPDLGCVDCSGNTYNHSSTNVKALINCWGATGNVNWIEPGEDVPIISFHGDQDLVVPYDSGFPFTALATMPFVYGSLPISERADAIGLYNEFYTFQGEGHNVWGTVVNNSFAGGPTVFFQPILHSITDFLFRFMKPNTEPIIGDSISCLQETNTYSVGNTTGSTYCWTVNGGSIVSLDSSNNSIEVKWNMIGQHGLSVIESNRFQARGDIQTYNVLVNPLPTISVVGDLSICAGDTVTIIGNGASTYQWSPPSGLGSPSTAITDAYPGATTTYTLSGTDNNNCTGTDVITITVFALPSAVIQEMNDTLVTTPGQTYQWFLNDTLLSGQTSYFVSTLQSGNYTVLVTDSNGCQFLSDIYAYVFTGIHAPEYQNTLLLYPNPNNGTFYIQLTGEIVGLASDIRITNLLGETVYQERISDVTSLSQPYEVHISDLTQGIYLAEVTIDSERVFVKLSIQ
ncbi:MAG: T9SS type A sorting domain-containing protein [Flavobacteriales bacterium]|nr:T9SS type A sorting domain-containing protein [Flavobacteriales bacterium]